MRQTLEHTCRFDNLHVFYIYTYQPTFLLKRKFPEKSRSIPVARRVSPSPGAVVKEEDAMEARLFLMLRKKTVDEDIKGNRTPTSSAIFRHLCPRTRTKTKHLNFDTPTPCN